MVQPGFDAAPNEVLISTKCKFSSKLLQVNILLRPPNAEKERILYKKTNLIVSGP